MDLAAYDLLTSAVLLVSSRGMIEHVNTAAEELFEASRKQLTGQSACGLFDADAALESRFQSALRGEFGVLRQDLSIARSGARVPVSLTVVPLEAQPWAALLEVRRPDQQVLLDRALVRGRDLDAQRESLRNLAHEVKNPLGGIRGAAQLLEAQLSTESLREYTGVIIAESDRLSRLLDRLIAPEGAALHKTRFNIHEVCERVHRLVHAEFTGRLDIVRDYDASVPDMHGDAARLLQALLNMARNAAQAIAENAAHGTLVMRTRIGRRLMLAPRQAKMGVVVSVIDDGPGVPAALREKIFHPLVTGRACGTGLGLSLAREYVRQHGGVIEFDSRPGHTEFRMILPLEPA